MGNSTNDNEENPLPFHAAKNGSAGFPATKRNVSETKKKYVASSQDWKCGNCHQQLDHTYEIDHRLRLQYGGSNDINNLVALCPNCHRKKTATEIM
jgi:5-methylcytosine-specific restriction endonuclease McrA